MSGNLSARPFRFARWIAFASATLLAGFLSAQSLPTFTNVTSAAGIDYIQGFQFGARDAMTGGAAATDFDGDGWTDLVVTGFLLGLMSKRRKSARGN